MDKAHFLELLINLFPEADADDSAIKTAFFEATALTAPHQAPSLANKLGEGNNLVAALIQSRQDRQRERQIISAQRSPEPMPTSNPELQKHLDRIHPMNRDNEIFLASLSAAISGACLA